MKHSKKNEYNVTSQKRCFSTFNSFRKDEIEDKFSKLSSRRKTLKSPESRPYEDLYKGRVSGTLKSLPELQSEKVYPRGSAPSKVQILTENQKKSGIYMFTYLKNGKRYIGSSENLKVRFLKYFNTGYLLRNTYMRICCALLKYGYSNFSVSILEYCEPDKCLKREKHYLGLLNPEYNIAKDPSAPMSGRKHSDETKIAMSEAKKGENNSMFGKNHSDETKTKISEAIAGENHPMYGKPKPEGAGRLKQQIEVTDIKNNQTILYDSIREAARALNCDASAIRYHLKSKKSNSYKGQYVFRTLTCAQNFSTVAYTERGQKRFYSTSLFSTLNLFSSQVLCGKTLKLLKFFSTESIPDYDLYKGRGKSYAYEPEWVKDNGMERSPFGAS